MDRFCVAVLKRRSVLATFLSETGSGVTGVDIMAPDHINPIVWHQSLGVARHSCARIFRDGGTAQDAARAFGVAGEVKASDWKRAVEAIAEVISRGPVRRAA